MTNRRRFLTVAGIAGLGTIAYSFQRGLRIPPLIWEPTQIADYFSLRNTRIELAELIRTETGIIDNVDVSLRAYAPEPALRLQASTPANLRLSVNNIATDARLLVDGIEVHASSVQITETTLGISRIIEIKLTDAATIELSWLLPPLGGFSFAAIGDSGGAQELGWCIERAHALGARFLLHLGDINYQPGDYDSAINLFNRAALPCYVSIGNHDFHDNGGIYNAFQRDIGPLNHHFSIGNTRFANLDTAASMLPYAAGHRGRVMKELIDTQERFTETVVFTHRPLYDPDPGEQGDHDIGSTGERDWMIRSLKQANVKTMLSGHIHVTDQREIEGLTNIIAGQGLGHQDLLVNQDHSKMAIGQVAADGRVDFEFAPLAMPMQLHCNSRSDAVKESLMDGPYADVIRGINLACGRGS